MSDHKNKIFLVEKYYLYMYIVDILRHYMSRSWKIKRKRFEKKKFQVFFTYKNKNVSWHIYKENIQITSFFLISTLKFLVKELKTFHSWFYSFQLLFFSLYWFMFQFAVKHSLERAAREKVKANGCNSKECRVIHRETEAKWGKRKNGKKGDGKNVSGAVVWPLVFLPHHGADLFRSIG